MSKVTLHNVHHLCTRCAALEHVPQSVVPFCDVSGAPRIGDPEPQGS